MAALEADYTVEVDRLPADRWHRVLDSFRDANLHQTWAYGAVRWGEAKLYHLVLRKGGAIVGAAQVRALAPRLLGGRVGIAYIASGPLWRLRDGGESPAHLRQLARALIEAFVTERGWLLTLSPLAYASDAELAEAFRSEGLQVHPEAKRTLVVDLTPTLEEIRKNLVPRWRTDLNRAERNGLEIVAGSDAALLERFAGIYLEMRERKGFVDFVDFDEMPRIQERLPDAAKLRIMLCEHEGEAVAGAITSLMGDLGMGVLWATSLEGRKQKAAYVVQWRVVEWLKAAGARSYDLFGVNKEVNPGGYRFKMGLAGRSAEEVAYVGRFEAGGRGLAPTLARSGLALRRTWRTLRQRFGT